MLSWDAKYLLLDGDTLALRDVGNLRWEGIWGVDAVLPGSSSARFALLSDGLRADLAQYTESGNFQRDALVVVGNIPEEDGMGAWTAISHELRGPSRGDTLWVEGTDQLIVWRRETSRVSLLDERLNVLDAWSDAGWEPGGVLACRRGEDLFVATGASRMLRRDGRSTVDALAVPDGFEDCGVATPSLHLSRVASPSAACRGTMGCRRAGRYTRVVVDIAENRVVGWHDPRMSSRPPERALARGASIDMPNVLVYAAGERLLLQEDVSIPVGPNAFRSEPGPLLRAVNTRTGRVLAENPHGATGRVSRVYCAGKAERTVIAGNGQLHLVDLDTLETIASRQIPFDRPYVF